MAVEKVVVTGGLGFIFSHVTEYLVKKGYGVIVIDNQSAGSHPEIIDGSFQYGKFGVEEPGAYETILALNPEYIIHAAAYSDVDGSIKTPREIIKANTDATLNVFEAARHCSNLKKLVYISTDEVYGECDFPKGEDAILFPKNPYSFSKAHGSLLRLAYDNTYPEMKDKTAETRFCNVFGPRQDSRKILARVKESLKDGSPVPVHNGGGGYREYIYVKNIPPIVEQIMLEGNRTYNITTNDGFTVTDLINQAELATHTRIHRTVGSRAGMDMKYTMDAARVRIRFAWEPEYSFEEGLNEYLYD